MYFCSPSPKAGQSPKPHGKLKWAVCLLWANVSKQKEVVRNRGNSLPQSFKPLHSLMMFALCYMNKELLFVISS